MRALDQYNDIFCKTFNVTDDKLNKDFTFKGVDEWDSLAHFTLIAALEDGFNVTFGTDDILHFESYENGKKILARMGVAI